MRRMAMAGGLLLLYSVLVCSVPVAFGATDPNDYAILDAFRKGLDNPELLKWPSNNEDACGPPLWPHVFCSGDRVTQIQVQELGLKGPLPQNLNQLPELYNLGLQKNSFTGPLPSFSGLSKLQYVYLDYNQFDSIPMDFFDGLTNLQAISLDQNPFNKSTGWALPKALQDSAQLQNFSCSQCNLVGPMPNFIGSMASLTNLRLAYNSLTGEIPASLGGSNLQTLILNNQAGDGLTGPIDILASMASLSVVWLHGNSLTGTIPENITACTSLTDLRLNNNKLTGVVPASLGTMKQLQVVKLDNNLFMGPTPNLKIQNLSYAFNSFCLSTPGIPCSPEVTALLDFLNGVNYPAGLAEGWTGNDPCAGPWLGINCFSGKVSGINLPNRELSGFISPSLGKLDGLVNIRLDRNKLVGRIPANLTGLKSLKMLNLTSNNLSPPIPRFSSGMTLLTDKNPLLDSPNSPAPSPGNSAPGDSPQSPSQNPPTSSNGSSSPSASSGGSYSPNMGTPNSAGKSTSSKGFDSKKVVVIASSVAAAILISSLLVFCLLRQRKKKDTFVAPGSIVVHPRDSSDPENMVKIVIADSVNKSITGSELQSARASNGTSDSHVIDSGNLKISVKILRSVTRNFSSENELGRGGFGVVYKGELHDGTMIAVKRMEASIISNKALDEFHSEIAVLSKVRHRNLVSLLGYSVEGLERLLVYEYMPQGALSKHLFHWRNLNIEPLSWKKRLNIALDVARGMEYLHNLAHQSFIHRDLKSSNILLGDDYRAKISDFGLVKLAPDGKNSVTTRLAGTFGYLAPEYAVTGKITTKADVFSFGVVLMEIVTGLTALDEDRPEETRYLASWFFEVKSSKEKLIAAIDPTINVTEETFESISVVAELAGHCAAREPQQRPDMGHAVNVLAPLVEKWKPTSDNQEEYMGIDLRQPLLQMVKGWQDADCSNMSSMSLDDSKGSIPARPNGFAESFTSADGR